MFPCHTDTVSETMWKGKYQNTDNTKIGKERGNSYQKIIKFLDESHT